MGEKPIPVTISYVISLPLSLTPVQLHICVPSEAMYVTRSLVSVLAAERI